MKKKIFPRISGTYLLSFRLRETQIVSVGALDDIEFKQGEYMYVGSAMNGNLYSRVLRHVKPSYQKKIHWHIDYLLALSLPILVIKKIYLIPSKDRYECVLANILLEHADNTVLKFGSSDCDCDSHLFYFRQEDSYPWLYDRLNKA